MAEMDRRSGLWIAAPIIVLASWSIFCIAAAVDYYQHDSPLMIGLFIALAVGPVCLSAVAVRKRRQWGAVLEKHLETNTAFLDSLPNAHIGFWIALAAGIGLYLELVLIRYHGSCFAIFGFFKNLSLLSCFLGLGVGYAMGRSRISLTLLALPLFAIEIIAMHLLQYTGVSWTLQNPISEQFTMGLAYAIGIEHYALVYGFLIWAFSLNALCFVPLGQLASRLMTRSTKLSGYGWNLFGSIVAVLLFWGMSFLWSPPVMWFAVGFLALLPLLRGSLLTSALVATLVLGIVGSSFKQEGYDLYSPYQILSVFPSVNGRAVIAVNHFFFQEILDLSSQGPGLNGRQASLQEYYAMPYQFQPAPQNVLIVGAGSGNDVASALRHGAAHIDAVEIDPLILRLGQMMHPEAPYASERVTAHVEDARTFFRTSSGKFDLIVYGLLDSHTALSGMSSVRLDSYIYTVEALKQARSCLNDHGVLCLSFVLADEEFTSKLMVMLKEAFDGQQPRIFRSPTGSMVFVTGANAAAYSSPAPQGAVELTNFYLTPRMPVDPSTDDWPFFYMPRRTYPVSYLTMIAILLAVSAAFIVPVTRMEVGRAGFSWPLFLLGAGFMLLETKAVTELALFYGSTWIVISIVILSILIMAFLANLLVLRVPAIPRAISYALLLASIALSLWFSTVSGSLQSQWLSQTLPTAILTLPLFFSGLVYSTELRRTSSIATAFGSNLIGAMLGGCLEYNSMYFGYRSLYVLAMIIYGLSMLISLVQKPKSSANSNENRQMPQAVPVVDAAP